MSIHIILGKPGSGKSRYAMQVLVNQLRDTKRNIVTNLAIKLPELNTYLNYRYPDENLSCVSRVTVLSEEDLKRFWEIRGATSEDKGSDGVCYILDEAHIAFNARDWAVLGRHAIHYMSQHRKLGDVVFPITQAVGNLDKQFRSVAEDYTVLRNEYTAKLGIFRGVGRFVRRSYYVEPSPNAEPFEKVTFSIDEKGLANCYDTAKGIGVHGSKADIGRRAKGISIYWIFPMVIATAMLCLGIPWFLGHQAGKFIQGKNPEIDAAARTMDQKPSLKSSIGDSANLNKPELRSPEIRKSPSERQFDESQAHAFPVSIKPHVTGYVVRGREVLVQMSDGEVVSDEDGRLGMIRRGRVKIDGKWRRPLASLTSSPSNVREKPVASSETTSVNGLPGEPVSQQTVHATASADSSPPQPSETGAWVTDVYGVQHLREKPTLGGAMHDTTNSSSTSVVVRTRPNGATTKPNNNVPRLAPGWASRD